MLAELTREAAALEARILREAPPPREIQCAFPQQRAYVYDDSQLQAAFCTRRAAKSYSGGLKGYRIAAKYPRSAVLIAGLHRLEIKRIYWEPILKRISDEQGLGVVFNETELTARLPNRSIVYLLGMDANEKEKRKALGQKFPCVIIDEAQDWMTDVNTLVFHVLKPAVADYRGQICLQGTPGLIAKGLFYDVTTGKEPGWKLHEWTTHDNEAPAPDGSGKTCAQQWSDEIAELKRMKPGVENTPAFRRNYLREWVVDEDKLVYRYVTGRNEFSGKLPFVEGPGRWHYILGIDLGYNDDTAFVLWAFHDSDPTLYGLETFKKPGLDITGVAQLAKSYDAARGGDIEAMVIDGSNKQAVAEMSNRHGLGKLVPADKTGKGDFIELMNADYITGRIKLAPQCAPLKEEYAALIWDDKSATRQEHPACPNHAADAGLYGWRYCYQYMSKVPEKKPAVGSPEWIAAQERALFEKAQRDVRQAKNNDGGDFGGSMDDWGASDWS